MLDHLSQNWRKATLSGRPQAPGGPWPVLVRDGRVSDVASRPLDLQCIKTQAASRA